MEQWGLIAETLSDSSLLPELRSLRIEIPILSSEEVPSELLEFEPAKTDYGDETHWQAIREAFMAAFASRVGQRDLPIFDCLSLPREISGGHDPLDFSDLAHEFYIVG
ncbi:hypothetical protein DL93DRAFT_2086306 [Clavulina sp. PMI_390]|nr:hypothetical protein DL93DRAFT_2086306 [Clavulina sp. PMI_390]